MTARAVPLRAVRLTGAAACWSAAPSNNGGRAEERGRPLLELTGRRITEAGERRRRDPAATKEGGGGEDGGRAGA